MITAARTLQPFGRLCFALALLGLGAEHFVFKSFVTGRAPDWPAAGPGMLIWIYASGALIAAAGLAILAGRHARRAALLVGTLIFAWALLRHLPVIAGDAFLAPSWTRAGKALALFGGAFAVAGTLPPWAGRRKGAWTRYANQTDAFVLLGRIAVGVFLANSGIQHFMYTPVVVSLIPEWFPGNATRWTQFAGGALIAGGVGLFFRPTAALAALLSGLMVFSWVWLVHLSRALTSVSDGIAVFEALAVAGIALAMAGFLFERRATNAARPRVASSGPA
ncbi:MAG: hypothetical protein ACREN5_10440 [Gemmatimonadales bacterium]